MRSWRDNSRLPLAFYIPQLNSRVRKTLAFDGSIGRYYSRIERRRSSLYFHNLFTPPLSSLPSLFNRARADWIISTVTVQLLSDDPLNSKHNREKENLFFKGLIQIYDVINSRRRRGEGERRIWSCTRVSRFRHATLREPSENGLWRY